MFFNQCKAVLLLGVLSSFLFLLGYWIGGASGIVLALIVSFAINFFTYFYSDKMVLAMYQAQPLNEARYAYIYRIVDELCRREHLPMPKLWYVPGSIANAFATGRNPEHASVAVTQGILDILNESELRGVLAHEISHIKNRDILVGTIAATMAMAIGHLANMIQWMFIFGSHHRNDEHRGSGVGALIVALIMPLAATLIQLAISRSREFLADESGARCCKDPLALAAALEKLHGSVDTAHEAPPTPAHAATASLFIVYPFSAGSMINLFSTHPPMEERVRRLRAMARRGY
ncbi:protease HtpX [Candidatus Dependentiae bacterium]|nr:protease HtpX [Candidatus Dependentiae bacterium]